MSSSLPALVGAVIGDLVSATGVALGGVAGAAGTAILERLMTRRLETARETFLEELRRGGNRLEPEPDEIVAIVYRYMRAAQEGSARLNLRLMAKVVHGLAHTGNLVADKFLYHADRVASLRREEIILLATIHRHQKRLTEKKMSGENVQPYVDMRDAVERDLVPRVFPDTETLRAVAAGTIRTGYIHDDLMTLDSVSIFQTTPLLDELISLAPLDAALDAESSSERVREKS